MGLSAAKKPFQANQQKLAPDAAANLSTKGPTAAAGAQLRSQPPKASPGEQSPVPVPTVPPTGAPGPPPEQQQTIAAQLRGLLGQWQPPPAPFAPPQMPTPSRGVEIGRALSALIDPRTVPFVGQQIQYDDAQRRADYDTKYKSALDSWNSQFQSVDAANKGLLDRASILEKLPPNIATMVPKEPTKQKGESQYEFLIRRSDWALRAGTALRNAGYTDYANGYDQQASSDRLLAGQVAHEGSEESKRPVKPGTIDPVTGELVTPGMPQALAYDKEQGDAAWSQHRVQFEQERLKQAQQKIGNQASQFAAKLADTSAFHNAEIAARYNIDLSNRQNRVLIATMGIEAAGLRQTAAQTFQAGLERYRQWETNMRSQAVQQAAGRDTSGYGFVGTQPDVPMPAAGGTTLQVINEMPGGALPPGTQRPDALAGITDQRVKSRISSDAFSNLNPETKMAVVSVVQDKKFDFNGLLKWLTGVARGGPTRYSITPQEALSALGVMATHDQVPSTP